LWCKSIRFRAGGTSSLINLRFHTAWTRSEHCL